MHFDKRKLKLSLIIFLIFIGTFLRFYRLRQTMQFLGDQGRDALIARRILFEHHIELIGPVTSVGNMYLGPLYYYFMVVPLMITYPDPIGPVIAVTLLGCITLWLVYKVGKEIIGEQAALIAMALYTFSPIVITNVRFSWNPNIVPFFSILLVLYLYRAIKGNARAWVWVGVLFSILIQLHYITLILGVICTLAWVYTLVRQIKHKKVEHAFITSTVIALAIFLVSLTPLIAFDVRHNFLNLKALIALFSATGHMGHFRSITQFSALFYAFLGLSIRSFFELQAIHITQTFIRLILFFGCIVSFIIIQLYLRTKHDKFQTGGLFMFVLFGLSIAGLSFYSSSIFDHYLGFLYPITFLCLGYLLFEIARFGSLRYVVLLAVLAQISSSLMAYPGNAQLGDTVDRISVVSKEIAKRVGNETFDILLFSSGGDVQGMNYRYFLTAYGKTPATEEEVGSFKRLYIIDELNQKNPVDTPQYKVALWPNRTIVDDFRIQNGPHVVALQR